MPKTPTKTKHSEYYQRNREKRNTQAKEYSANKRKQAQLTAKKQAGKYYRALNIKVLLSLKDYLESSPNKMRLWIRFQATIRDIKEGIGDIIPVMELIKVAEDLQFDYWKTAKDRKYKLNNQWKNLTLTEKNRRIKHWQQELTKEQSKVSKQLTKYESQLEKDKQTQATHKKLWEMEQFHLERGKKGCKCWQCSQEREKSQAQILNQEQKGKIACPECQKWVKELDEENSICKSCVKKYEN